MRSWRGATDTPGWAVPLPATPHSVPDDRRPAEVLARYRTAPAPGSLLAVTHSSETTPRNPGARRAGFVPDAGGVVEVNRRSTPPVDTPLGGHAVVTEPLT